MIRSTIKLYTDKQREQFAFWGFESQGNDLWARDFPDLRPHAVKLVKKRAAEGQVLVDILPGSELVFAQVADPDFVWHGEKIESPTSTKVPTFLKLIFTSFFTAIFGIVLIIVMLTATLSFPVWSYGYLVGLGLSTIWAWVGAFGVLIFEVLWVAAFVSAASTTNFTRVFK